MKLIVLSMHDELLFAERVPPGAVGYVSKDEVSRTIVQALGKSWQARSISASG